MTCKITQMPILLLQEVTQSNQLGHAIMSEACLSIVENTI